MSATTPLPVPDLSALLERFFLARQPILNRERHLVAYELLFRGARVNAAEFTDGACATAHVIAHAAQLGMRHVVGRRLAYVNVDAVTLMSDFIRFLPNDKVILEILESVKATPEILARVRELRRAGFKFALDDVVAASDDVEQLQALVDVVKVDIHDLTPAALQALVPLLRAPNRKLLAEKIETLEEFERCLQLGFEYFQGYYFARPVILSGEKIMPSDVAMLRLLALIGTEADNGEIERGIRRDELISLNLLRLVNTAAPGQRGQIATPAQALLALGRRQLQRWLQILLYVNSASAPAAAAPLLQLVSSRVRVRQLPAARLTPALGGSAGAGCAVGVMSLMGVSLSLRAGDAPLGDAVIAGAAPAWCLQTAEIDGGADSAHGLLELRIPDLLALGAALHV